MALPDHLGPELLNGKTTAPTAKVLANAKYIGLYFSAHWCGPCRNFTPTLAGAYMNLRSQGMQVIFISSDHDEASFLEYYGQMPWKAMPFSRDRSALQGKYNIQGIPAFYVLLPDLRLATTKGVELVRNDPTGQNLIQYIQAKVKAAGGAVSPPPGVSPAPSSPALIWAGPEVLNGKNVVSTNQVLQNAKYVGLYFSAHWCGPCSAFTPMLAGAYPYLRSQGMQIFFVSSDHDEASFLQYYAQMPWKAIQWNRDRQALQSHFQVQGIPKLIVLNRDFQTATTEGVELIRNDATGHSLIKKVQTSKHSGPPVSPVVISPPVNPVSPAPPVSPTAAQQAAQQSPLISWIGSDLLFGKKAVSTAQVLQKAKYVGLYFSAHWCGPCRNFTPTLASAYMSLHGQGMQIIFISSDHDEASFLEYYGQMPWKAMQFHRDRNAVNEMLQIQGIPALIVVNPTTGQILTRSGTNHIRNDPTGATLMKRIQQ